MPSSLHGIQVLDPHLGFAFDSRDSFERPRTARFDSRFGCHVRANVLYESLQLEPVNSCKRSNLVPQIMIEQGISTPTGFGLMLCPKHSGEYQFM